MATRSKRRRITLAAATVIGLFLFTGVGSAAAADRFVDADTGANTGDCASASAPCLTIAYAISQSAGGDTIKLDNGTYNVPVTLGNGRSLVYEDFVPGDGSERPLIDGGAAEGVTAGGTGGGTIRGVRVHSETTAIFLEAPTLVDDVVLDEPLDDNSIGVQVSSTGGGSEIRNSELSDPNPDPSPPTTRIRAGIYSLGQAWIHDNSFENFTVAINANAPGSGETVVEDNEVTGAYSSFIQGKGILAQDSGPGGGEVLLRENLVSAGGTGAFGIDLNGPVRLVRNEVTGHVTAVNMSASPGATIVGDRYWGNTFDGLRLFDTTSPSGASVTLTNVTIVGSGADLRIDGGHLSVNSSIVGEVVAAPGSTCDIDFSIGPPNPGGDTSGCYAFGSNADPQLVDPASGDLHLVAGSPAIDMGDPADPGSGEVDFDGDARAVDGADACPPVARRDIGADEFVPATPIDCTPPQTSITAGVAAGGFTNDSTPTFGFGSNESGSTFECALGSAPFGACTGAAQHTLDLTAEPDGEYTFKVRATDGSGNPDPTPASRTFTLDRSAPQTSITSGPPNGAATKDETPTFGIASSETGGSLQCKLDSGPFAPCGGVTEHTLDLTSAADGQHTFRVRAVDAAGNTDATPASRTFRLDSTAPDTSFTKVPPKKLRRKRAVFSFAADEPATFTCRLDSKPQFPCDGTVRLKVRRGKHSFSVFATDGVGNVEATPATYRFKRVGKKRATR